jgi:AraC-like DNA-binding protein
LDGTIEPLPNSLTEKLQPLYDQTLNCSEANRIREIITGRSAQHLKELDERLTDSIHWVKNHLSAQSITTEDLANQAYLSKSRFMHLFSDQIGIPVRKFILWQRLKHALIHLSEGESITASAHAAGFTDSAHMNRTFKTMFGITPSAIFKNSRFIQVFAC